MSGSKVRWHIAEWLNKHTRMCWASLVPWALYGERESLESARTAEAQRVCGPLSPDTIRNGCCYCGKFKAATVYVDDLPGMWERADYEGGIDEVRPAGKPGTKPQGEPPDDHLPRDL